MNNKLITILTPTYNRGYLIGRLYKSLLRQNSSNFEWVIVDDGSTDNTEELVKSFNSDNVKISYYKKENGGKHTALNFGINLIDTELTFIVDSDDYLTDDAIYTIEEYYKKYKDIKCAGFSFFEKIF